MAPLNLVNDTFISVIPDGSHSSENEKYQSVDSALEFLRSDGNGVESELVDEKKLLRKIDILIMPLLFGAYLFQYMDKSLINFAAVMGLTKDTHMTAAQFSYLATFFYVTYAIFQPLHAYLVQKLPVAKYLGVNVSLWGIMASDSCFLGLKHVLMNRRSRCIVPVRTLEVSLPYACFLDVSKLQLLQVYLS